MHSAMTVTLEPFQVEKHTELLEGWLHLPHVARWWIDPVNQLTICLKREHATSGHRLIAVEDVPVGYIRWEPLNATDLAPWVDVDVPDHVIDLDIFIGDKDYIGRGVGPESLRLLEHHLIENSNTRILMLAVSVQNTSAIRAYQKTGFSKVVEFDGGKYGPSQLMSRTLR